MPQKGDTTLVRGIFLSTERIVSNENLSLPATFLKKAATKAKQKISISKSTEQEIKECESERESELVFFQRKMSLLNYKYVAKLETAFMHRFVVVRDCD